MSNKFIKSGLKTTDTLNSMDEIRAWIEARNSNLRVDITKIPLKQSSEWVYDDELGIIRNKGNSFFSIAGVQGSIKGIKFEQPIIHQPEIGYLGIICKEIDGVLYFLMQAKIEPGNINKIQISPTIQATKSNFTQKHGGKKPAYLEYFLDCKNANVIVDQIQSEQSSRFYKKRNRNIIIEVADDIEVLPSHKWMTLGQIKQLMKLDNIVNMDTRTVISCLPMYIDNNCKAISTLYNALNDYKMFNSDCCNHVRIDELKTWRMQEHEFLSSKPYPFKVIFCDIAIEGREVGRWTQPLFQANGKAIFGLFTCVHEGKREFLIKIMPEIGCFDKAEFGPTVQEESISLFSDDSITMKFKSMMNNNESILFDTILSEEGGRFYHEENRNVIIEIDKNDVDVLQNYFWVDFSTINTLIQYNNVINIQLRNLIATLEVYNG